MDERRGEPNSVDLPSVLLSGHFSTTLYQGRVTRTPACVKTTRGTGTTPLRARWGGAIGRSACHSKPAANERAGGGPDRPKNDNNPARTSARLSTHGCTCGPDGPEELGPRAAAPPGGGAENYTSEELWLISALETTADKKNHLDFLINCCLSLICATLIVVFIVQQLLTHQKEEGFHNSSHEQWRHHLTLRLKLI